MKQVLFILSAVLLISACCGKQKSAVNPLEDSSDFVVITDVVPDVIL